jgi:hypothetical protein
MGMSKTYMPYVCVGSRSRITKEGQKKVVGLAYNGVTECNNSWLGVSVPGKSTPIATQLCEECKARGRQYPHVVEHDSQKKPKCDEHLRKRTVCNK